MAMGLLGVFFYIEVTMSSFISEVLEKEILFNIHSLRNLKRWWFPLMGVENFTLYDPDNVLSSLYKAKIQIILSTSYMLTWVYENKRS